MLSPPQQNQTAISKRSIANNARQEPSSHFRSNSPNVGVSPPPSIAPKASPRGVSLAAPPQTTYQKLESLHKNKTVIIGLTLVHLVCAFL